MNSSVALVLCLFFIHSQLGNGYSIPTESRAAAIDSIVSPSWLRSNFNKVKVIDASYLSSDDFTVEHIPGAAPFNTEKVYHSSQYIYLDLYPVEVFQRFVQSLGVNNDDHLVIYSRGSAQGMMWASRAYWTFKVYGFQNLSVLNGGLDGWKGAGGPTTRVYTRPALGNFVAKDYDRTILALFEDIPFNHLAENNAYYIDARVPAQFTGALPLKGAFPGTTATGSHVTGAINIPMSKVINQYGFVNKQDVDSLIAQLGIKPGSQVFMGCNVGVQASVILVAFERSGIKAKLYNGSMNELAYRAPELVNASGN